MHQLTMHEPWDSSVLHDESTAITFDFYLGDLQRYVVVDTNPDGTLRAQIIKWDGETVVGYANVWRPSEKTIRIEFPRQSTPASPLGAA